MPVILPSSIHSASRVRSEQFVRILSSVKTCLNPFKFVELSSNVNCQFLWTALRVIFLMKQHPYPLTILCTYIHLKSNL